MSKRLFMFAVKGRTRRPFTANIIRDAALGSNHHEL